MSNDEKLKIISTKVIVQTHFVVVLLKILHAKHIKKANDLPQSGKEDMYKKFAPGEDWKLKNLKTEQQAQIDKEAADDI